MAAAGNTDARPGGPNPGAMNPGDEVRPGSPQSGEAVCPQCAGTGRVAGAEECAGCGGTGKITQLVGDA